jgi:hypothetical protein
LAGCSQLQTLESLYQAPPSNTQDDALPLIQEVRNPFLTAAIYLLNAPTSGQVCRTGATP